MVCLLTVNLGKLCSQKIGNESVEDKNSFQKFKVVLCGRISVVHQFRYISIDEANDIQQQKKLHASTAVRSVIASGPHAVPASFCRILFLVSSSDVNRPEEL